MSYNSWKPWPVGALRIRRSDLKTGEKRRFVCEDGREAVVFLDRSGKLQRKRLGGVSLWRAFPSVREFIGRIGSRSYPHLSITEFQFYLDRRAADAAGTLDVLARERGVASLYGVARALESMFKVKAHVYTELSGQLRDDCLNDAAELLDQAATMAREAGKNTRAAVFNIGALGLADRKARAA